MIPALDYSLMQHYATVLPTPGHVRPQARMDSIRANSDTTLSTNKARLPCQWLPLIGETESPPSPNTIHPYMMYFAPPETKLPSQCGTDGY